jgi:hypothetical protein
MDEIKQLFKRLYTSQDGKDFIEYLENLDRENYQAFKSCPQTANDIHKGYAMAIDNLIQCFTECTKEEAQTKNEDWAN